jgi:heme-degrading monooxygenase HmoA
MGGPVFARVISAQATADQIDGAVQIAKQQLPGTRGQQGYQGFYLLADRTGGKLMTISLWESREDFHPVEARAARVREETAEAIKTTAPPVDVCQVVLADRRTDPG